jgi:hypothetical protein
MYDSATGRGQKAIAALCTACNGKDHEEPDLKQGPHATIDALKGKRAQDYGIRTKSALIRKNLEVTYQSLGTSRNRVCAAYSS